MAVLIGRQRTALPLENVLLERLSYVQQSQNQDRYYYLTWQNLINYSVFRVLSLVQVTFRNFRNISGDEIT